MGTYTTSVLSVSGTLTTPQISPYPDDTNNLLIEGPNGFNATTLKGLNVNVDAPAGSGEVLQFDGANILWETPPTVGAQFLTVENEQLELPASRVLVGTDGEIVLSDGGPGGNFTVDIPINNPAFPQSFENPTFTTDAKGRIVSITNGNLAPFAVDNFTDLRLAVINIGNAGTGGTIIALPGTYTFTQSIVFIGNNTKIQGCGKGTIFVPAGGLATPMFVIENDQNICIENVAFNGLPTAGANKNCVLINGTSKGVKIQNCSFITCSGGIVDTDASIGIAGSASQVSVLNNCFISCADTAGVSVSETANCVNIRNNNFTGHTANRIVSVETDGLGEFVMFSDNVLNGNPSILGAVLNSAYALAQNNTAIDSGPVVNAGGNGVVLASGNNSQTSPSECLAFDSIAEGLVGGNIARDATANGFFFRDFVGLIGGNQATNNGAEDFALNGTMAGLFSANGNGPATDFNTPALTTTQFFSNGGNRFTNTYGAPGANNLDGYSNIYFITVTSAGVILNLQDIPSQSVGHNIIIRGVSLSGNTVDIVPVSYADGPQTTITLGPGNDGSVMLTWNGARWTSYGNLGLSPTDATRS